MKTDSKRAAAKAAAAVEHFDMANRLHEIEETTRVALAQRQGQAIEIASEFVSEEPTYLIPEPRRSRMFLRHGEGHGVFSEVTLTSPVRTATA